MAIAGILHLVGLLGFYGCFSIPHFEQLTPWHLLACFLLIVSHQPLRDVKEMVFLLFLYTSGFFIEWLGVYTGKIFGQYTYGNTLGFKLLDIPIIIGINWVIVVYACGSLAQKLTAPVFVKIIIGSSLMVVSDYFIEPFAMRYNLWQWKSTGVPVHNYLGWAACGIMMQALYFYLKIAANKVAIAIWMMQVLFFIALMPLTKNAS